MTSPAKAAQRASDLKYGHGSALWTYWTKGEGFAKWSGAVHKWTALRDLLLKAGVPPLSVDGLTTNIITATMPGYMKQAHAKKAGANATRSAPMTDLMRIYPLEDIHILSRAEGDGTGRVVEAYATVFDTEAEIHDHQGHYTEVIDRTAFDQVLRHISGTHGGLAANVKVLYNHGKTIGGAEAPEFQLPLGKPLDVRPEARGLLTRTEYDVSDPFTERILNKIHAGTITAQSFVGGIMRSSPELRGPGDKYRGRNGVLTKVRRMALGLREYGPVLFPAYSGAEILGVRMSIPGSPAEDEPDTPVDEEFAPDMEDGDTGGTPEEVTSPRAHAHSLFAMRTHEAGIAPVKGVW